MEVSITSGATLTTFGEALIGENGRIEILPGGKLDAQFVNITGGVLAGSGEVFVGTGPITSSVRNLSGRIEPGIPLGKLSIDGDLSNLIDGTLAIDLGGTIAETQYDQLEASRFAFLSGTLEVSLLGFSPNVGDTFTILTAGEGVVGQFDQLLLPGGFLWDIDYLSGSVVLEVTGVGTLAGDFDNDGDVDKDDLDQWQIGFGSDAYDGTDFLTWQRNLGSVASAAQSVGVPEPGGIVLAVPALFLLRFRRRRLLASVILQPARLSRSLYASRSSNLRLCSAVRPSC